MKEFNKENLRQLVSRNGFRVLGVEIHGSQAIVTAKMNRTAIYRQFVISKERFIKAYNNNEAVECHLLVFGLDNWFKTKLY